MGSRHLQRCVAGAAAPTSTRAGLTAGARSFAHDVGDPRRARQLAVRKFCLFRQRTEPTASCPTRSTSLGRVLTGAPSSSNRRRWSRCSRLPTAWRRRPTHRYGREPCIAVVILYTAGLRRGELAAPDPRRYRAADRGSARFGRRSSTNPGWCRYRRLPTRHCVPTSDNASPHPFDTEPKGPLLCWAPTVVADTRDAAWVRRSTAWLVARRGAGCRRPATTCPRYAAQLRGPGADALVPRRCRRPVRTCPAGHLHGARLDRLHGPLPALRAGDAPDLPASASRALSAMSSRRCRHEAASTDRPRPIDRSASSRSTSRRSAA